MEHGWSFCVPEEPVSHWHRKLSITDLNTREQQQINNSVACLPIGQSGLHAANFGIHGGTTEEYDA